MHIGVPREIKNNEFRVALTPAGVRELVENGHSVVVETDAGKAAGFDNAAYVEAGANIVETAQEAWAPELVMKVKEPVEEEFGFLRKDLVLFTYLHLASAPELTRALLDSGATAIAYETVRKDGTLPLLAPMSRVAGKLAPIVGSYHLMQAQGGQGILIGGVAGTRTAKIAVIGGGVAGEAAAVTASGMGGDVTVVDIAVDRLANLEANHGGRFKTLASNAQNIEALVKESDMVIGSVLIPGASAPKLVTLDMVKQMRAGSVLVDIAIDQGGCFEGSHPTTHANPTFKVDGKLFYCVANMPGAVPETSTEALTNATLPYVLRIANKGWEEIAAEDTGFALGVNITGGKVANRAVFDSLQEALGLEETDFLPAAE